MRNHLILYLCILPSVKAAGVSLTCPAFRNGEKAVFECKINKTAIDNSGCLSPKKNVTFDWTLNTTLTKCSTLSPAQADCKQQEPTTPSSCWCDKADEEIFWYKFSYVVNEARDSGALLECKYCNLPPCKSATDSDSCTIKNFETSGVQIINRVSPLVFAVFLAGKVKATRL